MKNLQKNFIFDGTSVKIRERKLEMTSYLDNAYDVTNFFGCFEKFLAYAVFLPSFIVVRHQMAELTLRGSFLSPIQYRVRARTPSKIRLILLGGGGGGEFCSYSDCVLYNFC